MVTHDIDEAVHLADRVSASMPTPWLTQRARQALHAAHAL